MDCKKILCDSDEFDKIIINLKNDNLSRNSMPKIIVGTGLSASFGVPGMWELSNELKKKMNSHPIYIVKEAWETKVLEIDRLGLEEGLKSINTSETQLVDEIKKVTSAFILQEEQKKLSEIYRQSSGFEKFLLYLKNTCSVNHGIIDIMTPNYDRIVETLCDKCSISVITGFKGEIFRNFDPSILKNPEYQYNLRNNFFVRLFKPHGSINWVIKDSKEYLINDYYFLSKNSDTIEIIAPGSSKYEAGMLNNTFRTMREDFNELISDTGKQYSLFIYGYGFNDSHFNTVIFQNACKNVLILSKQIKDEVIEKALNNHKITMFYQNEDKEYMVYKGEKIVINRSLWNMDEFADVFLG